MNDTTVIVTGAANGIGRAIVGRCVRDGLRVLACDIDERGLDALATTCDSSNLSVHVVDVARGSDVDAFFARIRAARLESRCLVNNAGVYLGKSLHAYSSDEIQRVLAVNCLGAVHFTRRFVEPLLEKSLDGAIVNISSVSGQEGSSDPIYGLTKSALLGFTKSCAMNFAPHIRVNAVAPALVSTSLLDRVPPNRLADYRQGELLKDAIQPDDVADTVAFLLSDQARCYTGATFDLNNGHYRR